MGDPLVTCIVATRNRWHLLQRALAGARTQGDVPLEIVVVDDGSSDETERLGPELPGVRYLRREGGGAAAARNAGAAVASGRWLAFLDDDDEWLPGKLQRQLSWISGQGADLGTTGWIRVSPEGLEEPGPPELPMGIQPWGRLLQGNFVNTSTVVMARELFQRAGGFEEGLRSAEDWDLWLRAARFSPLAHLAEFLTRSHVRGGERLTADSEALWRNAIAVQERHFRAVEALPRPWRRKARVALADRCLCAGRAARRRGDGRQACLDFARALRHEPLYCARHLLSGLLRRRGDG